MTEALLGTCKVHVGSFLEGLGHNRDFQLKKTREWSVEEVMEGRMAW